MPLGPGTRLGPYEIVSALGAGGMGEVYRAMDNSLGRQVAIKVLSDAFAQDPERIARFEREAKTLAALNHPNIAIIHGLEKSQGTYALVMELVEGEDLSQRIARGPIALDEAPPIAKQIAEALEAAHEQGIIHRDLKPANIKVREDGTVKVLDFGLAKLAETAAPHSKSDLSLSPTITSPAMMTGVGVLLGTAAYMSPEQAKGRPADKRSDVWAFGCVLYEMLTGKRAFHGEDVSDTLAAVLRSEPDWTMLPANSPAAIRRLLRRCLEKDRKRRLDSAADARLEIDEVLATQPEDVSLTVPAARRRERLVWATAVAATAVAVGISLFVFTRPTPQPGTVIRFQVSPPSGTRMTYGPATPHQAVSPDGRHVAYAVVDDRGRGMLAVQSFDALQPRVLPGTDIPNLGAGGGGMGCLFGHPTAGSSGSLPKANYRESM
jgi:eukaryotic-like serine/threonine-protein kinase